MATTFFEGLQNIRLTRTYTIRAVTQLVKQDVEAIEDVNNVYQAISDTSVGVGDRTAYVASLESEKQGIEDDKAAVDAEFDARILFLQEQIDEINAL